MRAWCNGRRGPRRPRVEESRHVVRAEDVYTRLLEKGGGEACHLALGDVWVWFRVEVRPNAVWRHGRVFLVCPSCGGRRTRLYLPTAGAILACRMCFGMSYQSHGLRNYRDTPDGHDAFSRAFGLTQRDKAHEAARDVAEARRIASEQRWAARRSLHQQTQTIKDVDKC